MLQPVSGCSPNIVEINNIWNLFETYLKPPTKCGSEDGLLFRQIQGLAVLENDNATSIQQLRPDLIHWSSGSSSFEASKFPHNDSFSGTLSINQGLLWLLHFQIALCI